MKKLFSYIWPTTRRFSSTINGTLEITYVNGKKVLDTENANTPTVRFKKYWKLD